MHGAASIRRKRRLTAHPRPATVCSVKAWLVLLVAFWAWPGTSEVVETTVHAIQRVDDGSSTPEPSGPDEHGCPVTNHLCHLTSCRCDGSFVPSSIVPMPAAPVAVARLCRATAASVFGCDDPAPLMRPPIA